MKNILFFTPFSDEESSGHIRTHNVYTYRHIHRQNIQYTATHTINVL